ELFVANFVLTEEEELDPPDGSSIYDERGAVQEDNLFEWITVCPKEAEYCELELLKAQTQQLSFVPNPANGNTFAMFVADATGEAHIAVLDKVTGAVWRSFTTVIREQGKQRVQFSVSGLREGVYIVKVQI